MDPETNSLVCSEEYKHFTPKILPCDENLIPALFRSLNDYRAQLHFEPLVYNHFLEPPVYSHCVNMALTQQDMTHEDFVERISFLQHNMCFSAVTELVCKSHGLTIDCVDFWKFSPKHKQNLEQPNMTDAAFAFVSHLGDNYYALLMVKKEEPTNAKTLALKDDVEEETKN